ncbi:MAG: Rne/Rng family ribonuclease [Synergistaceae bacterium]|jgi:ribonuclease G|nr:Rne/Rng family ribonuclease [Synergistaceae bacterium]
MNNNNEQNAKERDMKLIVNVIDPEEMRVAILDKRGRLDNLYIERMLDRQRAGEIYKARVDSVLPGMNAAFLSLGDGRNGFLYLNDVGNTAVKPGMDMLVQVLKTPNRGKGARVSPRVSLAGRYLVLVPSNRDVGVSKRIEDYDERARLRALARKLRPEGYGLIVRTMAAYCDEESLSRDVDELMEEWLEVERKAKKNTAPCLLHRDTGLVERILRDELTDRIGEIVVDSSDEFENISAFIERFAAESRPELSFYKGSLPVFDVYGIERAIEEIHDRKVWLPSGSYLVIDQTEALTVIDVNTGKYIGSKDLRDTVYHTNFEAAEEIVRQMRLRAIGGIVVIDFIDMESSEDGNKLVESLQELFKSDRCKARVYGVTELGLVEITRKRARLDMRSIMSRSCPFCGGLGWVDKEETVAMKVKRFLRRAVLGSNSEAFLTELHPAIARYIADTYLSMWEEEFGRRFYLVESPEYAWDKFKIDFQGTLSRVVHRVEAMERREAAVVVHSTTSA